MHIKNNHIASHKVGIVGGMGPLAGVYLQQLIIEATRANTDQDHLEVFCHTNPGIADRTQSLQDNDGLEYALSVVESCKLLCSVGATLILLPCNTAHARFDLIQSSVSVPVSHMPLLTTNYIVKTYGKNARVGLLATDGARQYKVFESQGLNLNWQYPDAVDQKQVMQIIYDTKQKKNNYSLQELQKQINQFHKRGVDVIVLGCTELSLYYNELTDNGIVDPLRILAQDTVVKMKKTSTMVQVNV